WPLVWLDCSPRAYLHGQQTTRRIHDPSSWVWHLGTVSPRHSWQNLVLAHHPTFLKERMGCSELSATTRCQTVSWRVWVRNFLSWRLHTSSIPAAGLFILVRTLFSL